MTYRLIQQDECSLLECLPTENHLASEADALDWVGLCGEEGVSNLLLHAESLSPDFFDLRTGLAGQMLLKFSNYRLRVALLASPEQVGQGKFHEMTLETNRGNQFRVFSDRLEAERWLLRG